MPADADEMVLKSHAYLCVFADIRVEYKRREEITRDAATDI